MSLHGSIKWLMRICQLCGLAPLKKSVKWGKSSFLKAISIVFIILSALTILIIVIWPELFSNPNDTKIRRALFFVLLIANHIPAMTALLELSLKWDQQVKLWNIFEKLDILSKRHLNQRINYRNLKNKCHLLVMVWFCECLFLAIFDIISKFQPGINSKMSYVLTFCPCYVLTRLAFAYSIMLVMVVHEQLDVLNKYLKSVNKPNGYYICDQFAKQNSLKHFKWSRLLKSKSNLSIETLHSMKYIYCEIWKATEIIKNLTGWTLTVGLSNEFFVLNFNLFYIFACIFYKFLPISRIKVLLVFLANNLCNLLFVAHYSNKILNDVSKSSQQYYLSCHTDPSRF